MARCREKWSKENELKQWFLSFPCRMPKNYLDWYRCCDAGTWAPVCVPLGAPYDLWVSADTLSVNLKKFNEQSKLRHWSHIGQCGLHPPLHTCRHKCVHICNIICMICMQKISYTHSGQHRCWLCDHESWRGHDLWTPGWFPTPKSYLNRLSLSSKRIALVPIEYHLLLHRPSIISWVGGRKGRRSGFLP